MNKGDFYEEEYQRTLDQNKAQAEKIMDTIVDLVVQKMKEKNISAETETTEDEAGK